MMSASRGSNCTAEIESGARVETGRTGGSQFFCGWTDSLLQTKFLRVQGQTPWRFRILSRSSQSNMQTILSGFLTAGLLPIGEDDEKLKLLEPAAANLAKQIKEIPLLAQCRRATASGNRQAYAPALGGKDPAFGIDLLARSLIVFSIAMSSCCSHLRSAK